MKQPLITSLALGSVLAMSATTLNAAENPFEVMTLKQGYQLAHDDGKASEGKCGEGKCGEGKCGAAEGDDAKHGEGKCGEGKKGDGKCGEGKCGGKKDGDNHQDKSA